MVAAPPSDPFELTEAEAEVGAVRPDQPPSPPPYLDKLNAAQREAVEAIEGPVLVLAGAGTGKTRVLTTRLAHLLFRGYARPGEILAVTFTNKAAREMKSRVEGLIARPVEGMWIGTFHSIGARMLRQHAELVGLKQNFTILDQDDQVRLLKQLIQAAGIDEKRWPARMLAATINEWKDRGLTPDKVSDQHGDYAHGKGQGLYRLYQERLKHLNAADFGDLLLHILVLLQTNKDVAARGQHRFRYILVDEYQDTNVSQYLWLRLLAQLHKNLCCVGDDDQSIYSWRGAEVGNILRFEKDFPGARIIRLEQNYRSTPSILAAASGLIAKNQGRLGKTLWTDRPGGEKVLVRGAWDAEEEARLVCEEIEGSHKSGEKLGAFAILVRASFQTREFEERLLTLGLPYRVVGGLRFYEHKEIRDAIAYLRVIAQPDDDLAFERILNVPRRGIGETTEQALRRIGRAKSISLTSAAAEIVTTDEVKPQARKALTNLLESMDRWRRMLTDMPHADVVGIVLDESGYTQMLQDDKSPDAPGRLENLKELVRAVEGFENVGQFLEHVSLVMENDEVTNEEKVSLMTLHGAKGLEFDIVYLPGWEEELIPHPRALEQGGEGALEEERRLAHVAITRARRRLCITFAASRRVYNQWRSTLPSRFIDELPKEHIEIQSAPGLYRGRGSAGADEDSPAFEYGQQRPPRGSWQPARSGSVRSPGSSNPRSGVTSGGLVIDGRVVEVQHIAPAHRTNAGGFRTGERVFHQKFGYGRVRAVDGNRLEIAFDKAGTKKVIDSFVAKA
ncbi:MAG: DNA helicase II [Alphaproteobacteria bacterium]|nr:DNA helicase II [Alphaproteobacteria bacterium]